MAAPSSLSRIARRSAPAALLALAVLAAPARAGLIGPEPHSPNAEDISIAYWVMLVVAVVAFVAVHAGLIAAVLRFRARRGHRATRVTAGRGIVARVAGGLALVALVVLVFGIIITRSARELEPGGAAGLEAAAARTAQVGVEGAPVPDPLQAEAPTDQEGDSGAPLEIEVIGQQWLWRFEYPGGRPGERTFTYGELVVPVDTAVILNVTSTDVLHSWFVPSLGGQVLAVPGTTSQTWFKADEEGVYEGRSTTFSGAAYPAMSAAVRVVSPTEYQDHVETLEQDLAEAQGIVQQAAGNPAEDEQGGAQGATGEAP